MDPYCVLKFAEQQQRSNLLRQELNPVWNEVFTFDVETGREIMELEVWAKSGGFGGDNFEGKLEFDLQEYMDQGPHDQWFELQPQPGTQKNWSGRIRLTIQYVFSKTKMLTGYINMWSEQIDNEEMEIKELKQVLKHMESPFGYIKGFQMGNDAQSRAEDKRQEAEENKKQKALDAQTQDLPPEIIARIEAVEVHEKKLEARIDQVANTFAKRVGYDTVPWFMLTWYLLWLYTTLTILVMYLRPDFLNLTICTTALYMMFNTERITKLRFRMLVVGIFVSIFYDIAWFVLKHQEYAIESKNDGGGEASLRRFSLMMSYASFLLRVRPNLINSIYNNHHSFSSLWPSCSGRTRLTSTRSS